MWTEQNNQKHYIASICLLSNLYTRLDSARFAGLKIEYERLSFPSWNLENGRLVPNPTCLPGGRWTGWNWVDRTGGMEFQSKKVLKPVKVVVPDPERFLRKSGTSQPRMQAPKCTHSKSMLCVQCTPIVHCAGEDKWTAIQNMYSNPGKRRAARHVFIGPFYSVAWIEAKSKPTTHPELCWVQRLLQAYTGVKSHY